MNRKAVVRSMNLMLFAVTSTPCGRDVYEVDFTDWKGAGFPHPKTGEPVDPQGIKVHLVDEEDPSNQYGIPYFTGALPDGTFIRIFND
jgi:hypothetical protein